MLLKTASVVGLFGLDEYIKQHVEENLEEGESGKYLNDRITLRKIYNRGFMFSSLEKKEGLVKAASIVAGLSLIRMDEKTNLLGNVGEKAGMTLIMAGAASNVFDRIVRGKVIDYIPVAENKKNHKQVTANLGDFYIAIGGIIYAISRL